MWNAVQPWLAAVAVKERSLRYKITFVVLSCGISIWLRFALHDQLPLGFPYLTFFPAVVLTTFFAGTGAGIVTGVVCGLASWFYFIYPINSFGLHASTALALGLYIFIIATDIILIHVMRLVLLQLDEERDNSASLARSRELMFSELQHRISNNLQVISAMLQLQRRAVSDATARQVLDVAAGRLAVVARVQRSLHDPDRQQVEAGDLLRRVLPDVVEASGSGRKVSLAIDAEPVVITPDQSMPFGLIATELVSNAVEHGLPGQERLVIRVRLAREDGAIRLDVQDDGKGFPESFDLSTTRSLGLMIARQFSEQLGGDLSAENDGGARAVLIFPEDENLEAQRKDNTAKPARDAALA
ncbi:Two-component sensor histidine kinase, contains HisKA and HATPase domains [Poseidonocella pacifica]|uniref:histidine kinase n=1 Tax=Poseidonocella pacifica TaxID=871651 RepID=A0A1I0VE23_9RHOB|nr:histidine kinase dimerization/phosphoacceptor domain -containing protein [Poseidonocella pacifica]SFA74571.1 Two-component sensor histidine kinase, contains HisKA and HATPase domains [Poseidonocella pacifica]